MKNKVFTFLSESPEVKIIATVLIIAAVAVIIGILLRSTRLWYWKTDKIIDSIENMGNRMDSIEKGMDTIKISTERLIEEARLTNDAIFALQEKHAILLEAVNKAAEVRESLEGTEAVLLEAPEPVDEDAGAEIIEQVEDLEKSLEELKRQKEQLEADINARIRD